MEDTDFKGHVGILLFSIGLAFVSVGIFFYLLKIEVPKAVSANNVFFATTEEGMMFENDQN